MLSCNTIFPYSAKEKMSTNHPRGESDALHIFTVEWE